MIRVASWHNKALLSDKFSAALQNCRRARRYAVLRAEEKTTVYKATVIETFIATPSDIVQERALIRDIINEWNIVNSKTRNVILKDLGWENDIYSSFSDGRPQESINKQILEKSDLLIGVFWTRVGTPTGDYISGSVEEITKHINADKPVLLFFSDMPVRPPFRRKLLRGRWSFGRYIYSNSLQIFRENI